jgi:hypothetical protein
MVALIVAIAHRSNCRYRDEQYYQGSGHMVHMAQDCPLYTKIDISHTHISEPAEYTFTRHHHPLPPIVRLAPLRRHYGL